MKIFETRTAPNARRVRIFLAEKQVDVEYVQIDIQAGENRSAEMRARNPIGKIPVLELDDGTCISESVSICRYFEELHPEPALFGTTALEKATVDMWQRQVEFGLMMQIGMCFQHTTGYFKDRMTPIKAYGEEAGKIAGKYLKLLDRRLGESEYIAGHSFSVADITALCAVDFARVVNIRVQPEQENLKRWHQQVTARPSAAA